MNQLKRFLPLSLLVLSIFFVVVANGKITVGKIVDEGSSLSCDMTIGWFEGKGTFLNALFTFDTFLSLINSVTTGELISQGTSYCEGSNIEKITISGSDNTLLDSTIGILVVNPNVTGELDRKVIIVRGTTTITSFSYQTYVRLVVEGDFVVINGQSIAAGTYDLDPGDLFP